MRRLARLGPVALLASMTAIGVRAEAGQDNAADIIVLGQGLPLPPGTPAYGAVLIDRDRLQSSASGRIETILGDVAGFQQFRRSDSRSANPSAQGATLRALGGNASSRSLVLLDGVPIADPFFGYIPFNALAPERLSVIRVTRGGGAGPFGAGAVAGTIELASADRRDLPLFSGSAFYGSHDATELSAQFAPDIGGGFVALSGRWDRGDGFQTTPANQRVAASVPAAYRTWSTSLRAVAPLSDTLEIQATALVFRDHRTLRFAGADSSSQGQDASIRLISRGPWTIEALAYVQARDFSNIVISATSFRKTLDQRSTPSTGVGGKIEIRPPLGADHLLRVGADIRTATGTANENAFNGGTGLLTTRGRSGGDQTTFGVFVEDDWTIGKLILTGGLRADRWSITNGFFESIPVAGAITATPFPDRHDWRGSARAGALFGLSNAVALRGAAYSGFRLPTLNELYRPFTVFPVRTLANATLKPERLKGVEAGIDLKPIAGLSLGVTAFYNRLDDAIANITIGTNLRQRGNVEAIIAKGIELTANAHISTISLAASYAFSRSSVKAPGQPFDGLRPAQSPRHALSATLSWTPRRDVRLSATVRYTGKQYEDDLQTDALPAAWTVDAVARLPLGHGVSLVGRAENLFDEAVVTRNAAGSIDLGTPRTLWIGLRFGG